MYLVLAMTVVAVMATGVHVMSLTAPALAEQSRQARAKEAVAEHNIVPHAPAAADGLPVPILVGGIVLAFAVGLTGGHLHRRHRLARRQRMVAAMVEAEERPRTVQPPPAPAPEPPAPVAVAPQPVAPPAPAPEPAPEPPAPKAPEPRVVEPPAAPAPPPPAPPAVEHPAPKAPEPRVAEPPAPKPRVAEPPAAPAPPPPAPPAVEPPGPKAPEPRVVEPPAPRVAEPPAPKAPEPRVVEPLRLVVRAPKAPAAEAPLDERPEVPRGLAASAAEPLPVPPLAEAPEALRVPPSPEAPEPQAPAAGPARRFARVAPWPEEADQLWTCELDWKAGYRKAAFRAMAGAPGGGKRRPLGESAPVKWALKTEPEPPTPELAVRVRSLVDALEAAGWEHIGRGRHWYEQRFVWRASGDPQPVTVAVEPAER
jgi:hypothetical protein